MGPKTNRGSKQAHLDLIDKAEITFNYLRRLCDYANSLYRGNSVVLASSGLKLSSQPGSTLAGAIRDLRHVDNRLLESWQAEIGFKKPLDLKKGAKINYEIWRSATPNFSNAETLETISKTKYIDTPLSAGDAPQVFYYWVRSKTASGSGPISDPLPVRYFPIA